MSEHLLKQKKVSNSIDDWKIKSGRNLCDLKPLWKRKQLMHGWSYDETKPTKCVFCLAVGNFKWLIDFELENKYPKSFTTCITTSYLLFINRVEKLIHKERHVIYHKNLKQYLDLGLKIKTIYRGISFKEESWLESHIYVNTRLRIERMTSKGFLQAYEQLFLRKDDGNIRNYVDVREVKKLRESIEICRKTKLQAIDHIQWKSHRNPHEANEVGTR